MESSTNTDNRLRWLLRALRPGIGPRGCSESPHIAVDAGGHALRMAWSTDQAFATFDAVIEAATHLKLDYSFRATMAADGSIKLLLRPVR
jgi:hypothetical protein